MPRAALLVFAVLATGCYARMTARTTARLHAANFGCSPDDVLVEQIQHNEWNNRGMFVASGCGVRQTYLCASNRCIASGTPMADGWAPPAAGVASGTCDPPCSPGYDCQGGVCRGLCNPSCAPGYFCADDRQCHAQ